MDVLLLGGTGRTGRRVLRQLLARGVRVRAVVRSAERVPADVADDPLLTVVVGDLGSLSDDQIAQQLDGCEAVISCLGHNISLKGVYGAPRDLVCRSVERVCTAARHLRPAQPVKLILMSSVSVNRPGGLDTRRGRFERAVVWMLRGILPPARDNQRAADFLQEVVGAVTAADPRADSCADPNADSNAGPSVDPGAAPYAGPGADPYVQWVAVRPDTLRDGDVTEYSLHEGLVDSLLRPADTNRANVAHFMCELATNPDVWVTWRGKLPVIVNASPS